jgi:hypothetical protein
MYSSTLGPGRAAGRRVVLAATALAATVFTLAAGDAVAGGAGSPRAASAVGARSLGVPVSLPDRGFNAPGSACRSTGTIRTGGRSTSR